MPAPWDSRKRVNTHETRLSADQGVTGETCTARAPHPRRELPSLGAVDNRSEVRDFLTSRRAKITPERAGVTSYGSRRVPGLRRNEVAQLAGVSIEYYSRLERGNLTGVSDSVLDAIARALNWTRPSAPTCTTSPTRPDPQRANVAGPRRSACARTCNGCWTR